MNHLFNRYTFFLKVLLISCLLLFIITAVVYAAPSASPDLAKLECYSNISEQVLENQLPTSRTVVQVIDNRFYKWQEYENPATGAVAIYQLEPEETALCKDEAYELLLLSGQWKNDYYAYQSGPAMETTQESVEAINEFDNIPGGMTDDRTAVNIRDAETYPYNTIGFLTTNFPYEFMRGTAFLVSPHMAITNAHNIYSPQFGGWHRTIRFTPAQYEDSNMDIISPNSTLSPDKAVVNSMFKDYEDKGDREKAINYDYGAIFFETPISGINTFMPLEFNHLPEKVSLLGYPGNVRGKLTLGMWLSEGPLIKSDEYCLYYEAYTSGGSSGSPVFVYNEAAGTYRVVAIHSFASANYFSGGPHLNDKNRIIIEEWLRWTPESEAESPSVETEELDENEQELMIPELSLNRTELSLVENDTKSLIVTVNSDDISYDELIWISKNPRIATVENNGVVKGVREGRTTVKVTTPDGRVETSCEITVISTTGGRLPGDINGDNLVDVQDVVLVTRHILNHANLDENQLQIADVNNDGTVDVRDVTVIMQFALGLIDTF